MDDIFDRIDTGTLQAATSPFTLAECLILPIRNGLATTQQDFTDLIVSGPNVTFVPLEATIGRRAAELRARYNLHLADAFQIAAALAAGCGAFLTNDLGLRVVTDIPILVVDDLEL